MRRSTISHIQKSIAEKSLNLEQWLETCPVDERETCLAEAAEQDVHTHLDIIGAVMQKTETETFGVCEVCQGEIGTNLMELDYTSSVCLDCLSKEEQRSLETELALSQTVQRALMPQEAPTIPGMDAAAFSRPAQIVSGDYFDFIPFADGSFALTIADAFFEKFGGDSLVSLRGAITAEAAPAIQQRIMAQKMKEALASHLGGLKNTLRWEARPENLFFRYQRSDE